MVYVLYEDRTIVNLVATALLLGVSLDEKHPFLCDLLPCIAFLKTI